MANRLKLQKELETILGSRRVYFQEPENVRLEYPCIIYELADVNQTFADNIPYINAKKYNITLIDRDPDTELFDKLLQTKHTTFDRSFKSDNLYHFVFNRYY